MKEGLLAIIKFFFFLLIVPLIVASALAFQTQILSLPADKEQWLLWGVLIFILAHLFLYHFKEVYLFGHNIASNFFRFLKSLANVGGLIIPIYAILIVCLYLVLNLIGIVSRYEGILLLSFAFSVALHIILTANHLYEADNNPIKAQYFLGFGLAFVINMIIISLLLTLVVPEFSFMRFIKLLFHHSKDYYQSIYKLLFVSL